MRGGTVLFGRWPLRIEGQGLTIVDQQGRPFGLAGRTVVSLCRCGASANKPFCDGSHKGTGLAPVKYTAPKTGDYWLCACKHTHKQPLCDGTHKTLA